MLAVGGFDQIATILDAKSGEIVSKTVGDVASITWSKDARLIAIGTEPKEAKENGFALVEPLMSHCRALVNHLHLRRKLISVSTESCA